MGEMIVVEIAKACVTRIGKNGRKTVIAKPGGGPNGAAFGPDGQLYICNSGGFAWKTVDGGLEYRPEKCARFSDKPMRKTKR